MTDEPAAKPSIPSVRFAPFDTELIISVTKKTNTIKLRLFDLYPVQVVKYE